MVTKYLLRLDLDLYEKLQQRAEDESRSVNSMIVYIIKQYLKK